MAQHRSRPEIYTGAGGLSARARELIVAVRQNHALEHGTIAVLMRLLDGKVRVVGWAGLGGFYIYGSVPTDAVEQAAQEALRRLQEGERHLAVSPMCGTNIVVAGLAAGVASMIAGRGHTGMRKFSRVAKASILAVLISQPLGHLAQKHLTTSSQLDNVAIGRVVRKGRGVLTRHKVELVR